MNERRPTRVLLICMVDSIHVARWISQFDPREVEFTLFPSTPNRRIHSLIVEMMTLNGNIKIVPFGGKLSIPLWALDLISSNQARGFLLRLTLRRLNPDFLHALEFQHAGYIAIRALADTSIRTKFIATNYGSDIFWFQKFPKHLKKIKKILSRADKYSAECFRDVLLANKLGYQGEVLPVFPNAGMIPSLHLKEAPLDTLERKTIAIKGYEGWAGKASAVISAIHLIAREVEDYDFVFYSCNLRTICLLRALKRKTNLRIFWHWKGALSHKEMLELLAKSKLYIGISQTDGISTSLLEAMAMGAFPLQTHTACTAEWFSDGRTGISVKSFNPIDIAQDITVALQLGEKLLSAATINRETILREMSVANQQNVKRKFYDLKVL